MALSSNACIPAFVRWTTLSILALALVSAQSFGQETVRATPIQAAESTGPTAQQASGNPEQPESAIAEPVESAAPSESEDFVIVERPGTGSIKAENAEHTKGGDAESTEAPKPAAAVSPAISNQSVSWRQRYELGPGDALNFGLHGKPTLKKLNVVVAPDGTISYLQARQINVLGKTIDEVREEIQEALWGYHSEPKVIVTPAALGSKHFTILGEVRRNGHYPLDRPMRMLDALAKSGGFNLGSYNQEAIELADLDRSFIVRKGRKLDVDLEALYLKGDLKQNIQVEPGDYIYIASKLRNEVYVFGWVQQPGIQPMETGLTTIGAISSAGGFQRSAWRDRVLIIRGRIESPERIVIPMKQIVKGRATDVPLEPGDIVYVHHHPWAYAEQILDAAIIAFIDGSVAGALADSADVSISR